MLAVRSFFFFILILLLPSVSFLLVLVGVESSLLGGAMSTRSAAAYVSAGILRRQTGSCADRLRSGGVASLVGPALTSCTATFHGRRLHLSSGSPSLFSTSQQDPDITGNEGSSIENIEQEMSKISAEITVLNNGTEINPNSPAQVSAAIFGRPAGGTSIRPVPREVLLELLQGSDASAGGTGITERQRTLASLVLRHRQLKSLQRRNSDSGGPSVSSLGSGQQGTSQQQQQLATFSTSASLNESGGEPPAVNDAEKELLASPKNHETARKPISSDRSPYGLLVDSFFNPSASLGQSKLDPYWHSVLDRITKPSARAMVYQLDPYQCPMAYNPAATPYDARRTSVDNSANAGGDVVATATATATKTATTAKASTQGKKGSLLAYVREQKEKFSDCVVITRVGDFYEAFGIDAILLVEFCGLNPMAGRAKAGCPIANIQPTLDCLTRSGFRVAVYEEAADTDAAIGGGATGGSKSRLKNRMLAQIVSSASPTYLYDLILGNGDTLVTSPTARPHVGIISTASGYTIVEISSEERTVRVSERVTAEAVACKLAAYPPADPLFYVPSPGEEVASPSSVSSSLGRLPFLPSRSDPSIDGPGSRYRVKVLPSALLEDPSSRLTELDRARKCIINALLKISEFNEYIDNTKEAKPSQRRVTHEDFALIESSTVASASPCGGGSTSTNPLYVETATQLGLMADATIPPLVSYLLPDSAPAPTRRFLRRWLLTPPLPHVADSMATIVGALKDEGMSLPPLSVPPLGKVLALIRAGQASAQVYREILSAMDATVAVLNAYANSPNSHQIASLSTLVQHESGIAADPNSVKARCLAAMEAIDEVVSTPQHSSYHQSIEFVPDPVSDYGDLVPFAFLERNEATWRGRIKQAAAETAYKRVSDAADKLAEAVAHDFWGIGKYEGCSTGLSSSREEKSPILQDIFNNIFAIKSVPAWAEKTQYYHPRDRNGKELRTRYTTERVDEALKEYVASCEDASSAVESVLAKLAQKLCDDGHLPAVVQASHTNLILSTAAHHAANANTLGWNMASIEDDSEQKHPGHFDNVWPYWMDRSESVGNTFTLDGLFLLTAPNMSGKSTVMRSTAAAALLTICGLCAPLGSDSYVRRFDNIFVRGASADVPTESKSAFGAEMGDIAALLRACGKNSLVFVDEVSTLE